VSRIRKKTFDLQFSMETLESLQKIIFSTSEVKKKLKSNKGSIRRSLQAQPKIIKKNLNTKSTAQYEFFFKKTMYRVSYLKNRKKPKICMGATELAGSTQNLKKNIEALNQPDRTKIYEKKLCLVS
jgi:hypothetical protein